MQTSPISANESEVTETITVAKVGRGAVAPPFLFVLTRSVGTSSTVVGTLSLSVVDSVCVSNIKLKNCQISYGESYIQERRSTESVRKEFCFVLLFVFFLTDKND